MAIEGPQQSIAKRPTRCRKTCSILVRRLVQARDDSAKQRMRRWLSDINDERLLSFGLTPEDIALLRSCAARAVLATSFRWFCLCLPHPVHGFRALQL
jgi:hypothetical protein